MPHRAGYFVLAYNWDHHCEDLLRSLREDFQSIISRLEELDRTMPSGLRSLLVYYQEWHYSKELYCVIMDNINRKQSVINSLGYRGYGVNIDLLKALEALRGEYAAPIYWMLKKRFDRNTGLLKKNITLSDKLIDSMNSGLIIARLCAKLKLDPSENLPAVFQPVELLLEDYFSFMSGKAGQEANSAVLQKLFLNSGNSSITIMKGSMGHHNILSEHDLKIMGNRNFLDLCRHTFSNLNNFADIGTDLLKHIHFILSRDIDPNAGNFREHDFHDRNGVTVAFGNFERELGDLAHVLRETGESFDDLDAFIYNLSRSYYMLLGIHPFLDSNGRVGRGFVNYMLLKKGLPPISFDDENEIFAFPRYGGTIEDMHNYIKARIMKAVAAYSHEWWKLEHFGLLSKHIYNVSFDSGFHFRQIRDGSQSIEVDFPVFIIDDGNPLSARYREQCRVVLPDKAALDRMVIHCGFSHGRNGEWEHIFDQKERFFTKEAESDVQDVRVLDTGFIIKLKKAHLRYSYFNCCLLSRDDGSAFNNKGLNYSYRMVE